MTVKQEKKPFYWALRDRLGSRGRKNVRTVVDRAIAPILGSIRTLRAPGEVAITFDDGPDPAVTPVLLAALRKLDVTCTFFLLTSQCRLYPELVEDIRRAGHEIALHGDDHRRITGRPYREALRYLRTARDELEEISGGQVSHYRPPYGAQSVKSYLAARRAGLEIVVWSADAADWEDRAAADVAADGLAALTPGGILLLHERLEPDPGRGAPATSFDRVAMARLVIDGARSREWKPVTVRQSVAAHGAKRSAWFRP